MHRRGRRAKQPRPRPARGLGALVVASICGREVARDLALIALELGGELFDQADELAGDVRRRRRRRDVDDYALVLGLPRVLALVPVAKGRENGRPVTIEER